MWANLSLFLPPLGLLKAMTGMLAKGKKKTPHRLDIKTRAILRRPNSIPQCTLTPAEIFRNTPGSDFTPRPRECLMKVTRRTWKMTRLRVDSHLSECRTGLGCLQTRSPVLCRCVLCNAVREVCYFQQAPWKLEYIYIYIYRSSNLINSRLKSHQHFIRGTYVI